MKAEEVYEELDSAQASLHYLGMVNSISLDTPEKRFQWEMAYQKAFNAFNNAMKNKDKIIKQELNNE